MKAIHHVVRGDLNLDEIINEGDALEWFPELKGNKLFDNFHVKSLTIDLDLEADARLSKDVKRIYFVIEP